MLFRSRDNRWERVKLAWDLMVKGTGSHATDPVAALEASYAAGVTDEFVKPVVITGADDQPVATIHDGDVVICFNFRTDRGRQITQALTQQDFHEQDMHKLNLHYITLTNYDDSFKGVRVMFGKPNLDNTLGAVLRSEEHTSELSHT